VGTGNAERDVLQDENTPVDPFRAYSIAKWEAEKGILGLSDHRFFPIVLRKGSIYGYSRRTRMDLVVHTFVRQAMTTAVLTLHNGGEMWRPLLSIRDAVTAYLLAISAPAERVAGEIFNVLNGNYRISELALRVRHALLHVGINCELKPDYEYRNLRSCRMSGRKFADRVGFVPQYTVESAVIELVSKIKSGEFPDPDNPIYHNIRWLDLLENENRLSAGPILHMTFDQLRHVREAACAYL
jgi:nucleoside-diphosphate-sugar epimerase